MLACYDMGGVPADEDSLVTYLSELAKRTQVLNPNLPLPIHGRISPIRPGGEDTVFPEDQSVLWPAHVAPEVCGEVEVGAEVESRGQEADSQQQEENGAEGSVLSLESEEDGIVNMSD